MNTSSTPPVSIPLPSPDQLLEALRAVQPRSDLLPTPDPQLWLLQLGRLQVRLRWLGEPERLELSVDAGELPQQTDEAMYRALLAYNSLSRNTRGTRIALDRRSLQVLCDQPAGQCSASELQEAVWHLIDAAHSAQIWMHVHLDQQLATADETSPVH